MVYMSTLTIFVLSYLTYNVLNYENNNSLLQQMEKSFMITHNTIEHATKCICNNLNDDNKNVSQLITETNICINENILHKLSTIIKILKKNDKNNNSDLTAESIPGSTGSIYLIDHLKSLNAYKILI